MSPKLIALVPPQENSSYAEEGTAAHTLAEIMLRGEWPPDEVNIAEEGKPPKFIETTEEMIEAVEVYVWYVNNLRHAYSNDGNCRIAFETRVQIPNMPQGAELFGTADCFIYRPYVSLEIVDYKHGKGYKVDPIGNKQLLYYALGVLLSLHPDERKEIPKVLMTIVQPRGGGNVIRTWEVDTEVVLAFEQDLRVAINKAYTTPELKPGTWCRFCPAAGSCPALYQNAVEIAQADFAVIETVMTPELLPLETRVKIAENYEQLKAFLDAVWESGKKDLEQGKPFGNFKLGASKRHRKWTDIEAVEDQLGRELGPAVWTSKLKTPRQIELLIEAAFRGGGDRQIKERLLSLVNQYIEVPEGRPVMVPDSDIREAVPPQAVTDFTII